MREDSAKVIKKMQRRAGIQGVLGVILVVMFGFVGFAGVITETGQEVSTIGIEIISTCMLIVVLGILLIIRRNKKVELIRVFHKYSPKIARNSGQRIEDLAFSVGEPVEDVMKNMTEMMAWGLFSNIFSEERYYQWRKPNEGRRKLLVMPEHEHKKSFPWGVILLLMYFFFPVGIWMLAKKVKDEKWNYFKNGESLKIFGWGLSLMALFYFMVCLTEELKPESDVNMISAMLIVLILFLGGGLFLMYKAKGYIRKGLKYNRYLTIIRFSEDLRIDTIAGDYPVAYEVAVQDLNDMLADGYLNNAYVDMNRRELVINDDTIIQDEINQAAASADIYQSQGRTGSQTKRVECPNCGAMNKIVLGAVNECEYCRSIL